MQIEKRRSSGPVSSFPHWLAIALSTFILLGGFGLALAKFRGEEAAEAPTASESPTPSPEAAAEATATPEVVVVETPTPTPTPTTPAATPAEARAAYQGKEYAKAIRMFNEAITVAQGTVAIAQLQYELGNAYRDNKQLAEALNVYALATAQNKQLVVAYQARANVLIAQNKRGEARAVLEEGLANNPGNKDLERDISVIDLSGPSE
ncbi:MAG TPA: hypothetical protein VLA04_05985 [Verrucomicrobiae bacterium]|nr:hypothetical protein [Verrucomicrobiae bacterium]